MSNQASKNIRLVYQWWDNTI